MDGGGLADMRVPYKSLVRKSQGKNHLEDRGVEGKTANCSLNEQGDRMLNGFIHVTLKTGIGFL